jgi:hypothetical protein
LLGTPRFPRALQCELVSMSCISHELRVFRGSCYCARNGFYAVKAPERLKDKCQGLGKAGETVLARIQKGLLPPGLRAWPDELVEQALSRHVGLEP